MSGLSSSQSTAHMVTLSLKENGLYMDFYSYIKIDVIEIHLDESVKELVKS